MNACIKHHVFAGTAITCLCVMLQVVHSLLLSSVHGVALLSCLSCLPRSPVPVQLIPRLLAIYKQSWNSVLVFSDCLCSPYPQRLSMKPLNLALQLILSLQLDWYHHSTNTFFSIVTVQF